MNGVHDMGGMDGFGPVVLEPNEPVFHHDWEGRVFGLRRRLMGLTAGNDHEFRHAIERIPPARYLASSYYERWLQGVETVLVERGFVTREELASLAQPEIGAAAREAIGPEVAAKASRTREQFKAGDSVRVRSINPQGHTRCPRYVRGKVGVVRRDYGIYVFPDTNAHRIGENRQHVYSVEFTARELWGKNARERVMIDLWEDYLEKEKVESRVLKVNRAKSRPSRRARGKRQRNKFRPYRFGPHRKVRPHRKNK